MYTEAKQDAAYSEINVEDPSPGFQQLRDSVDLQLCVEHGFFQAPGGAFDQPFHCYISACMLYFTSAAAKLILD